MVATRRPRGQLKADAVNFISENAARLGWRSVGDAYGPTADHLRIERTRLYPYREELAAAIATSLKVAANGNGHVDEGLLITNAGEAPALSESDALQMARQLIAQLQRQILEQRQAYNVLAEVHEVQMELVSRLVRRPAGV